MPEPTWLPIPGFPDYEVSDDGQVRSLERIIVRSNGVPQHIHARVLHPYRRGRYLRIGVPPDQHIDIQRAVCLAFHGPATPGAQARHLNGNPLDNRAVNLAWGTRSENSRDKVAHGTDHQRNKTHCPAGHPYDEANTYIRPSSNKRQGRVCKTCRNAYQRQWRAQHTVAKAAPRGVGR